MKLLFNLFPTVTSLIIFICYMIFCVGQGIFVTASHSKGENYSYNTVAVVLLTEETKLIIAYLCYIKHNDNSSLWTGIRTNVKVLCYYLIPSFLYCIYNNLAYVNLSHFDPTSYFILLQLRVVITGIIFQLIFNKKLTKIQWLSLGFLTFGCAIQQVDWDYFKLFISWTEQPPKDFAVFPAYFFLIVIQTLCSCFAGVYNEHLLKNSDTNINIFIQNIFMYVDSVFWNLIVLTFQGNLTSVFSLETIKPIFQPLIIILILNNSLVGITTSFFLKNLNSILKTFASAMELLFTAVLSWIIFGIEIKFNTIIAIIVVSFSLYIYSKNPVNNVNKNETAKTKEDEEILI